MGRPPSLTEAEMTRIRDRLVAGYANGQSIRALADAVGRSYGFVRRALVARNVQMRPRGTGGYRVKTPSRSA